MQNPLYSLDQKLTAKKNVVMKTHPLISLKSGPNASQLIFLTVDETTGETSGCSSGRPVLTRSAAKDKVVFAWRKKVNSHRDQLL